MAVSQEDIVARIQQIQQAGGGDTAATRAQIAQEAQQYGVDAGQIAGALQSVGNTYTESDVRSMAQEAGQAFAPVLPTGGMMSGTSIDLTQPSPVSVRPTMFSTDTTGPTLQPTGPTLGTTNNIDLTQPSPVSVSTTPSTQPVTVGMPEQTFERYTPTITSGMLSSIETGDQFAFSDLLYNLNTSDQDLAQLRPAIENIAKSATGNQGTDPAYNFLVQSAAEAKLKEDYNNAVDSGNTDKAQEIRTAVLGGPTTSYSYYLTQYPEGSAHKLVQDTFNDPFNIGDPGEYQTSFFENIGDAVSDVVQNPYVQAATAFIPGVGPAVSSVLQAWGTLDSGDELSPAQIVAAVTGVSELSGLEGGNLLASLPPQIRETATAIQKGLEGGWDEAYSALKDAGLEGTSEQFAAFEDAIRNVVGDDVIEGVSSNIAGIEDALRNVIGDENIEAISGGFANFEDFIRGQFGTQQDQIDELVAALSAEQSGSGFTPQRGYQPGLAVDLNFDLAERSSVLDILNQPSSVSRA